MTDDLVARVENDLRRLADEDADLNSQEEKIRSRRIVIRDRMAYLTGGLEFLRKEAGAKISDETRSTVPQYVAVPLPVQAQTVADLAAEIMREHGGTMKVRAVLDELGRRGKLKGTRSDYGTVFGTLSRNPKRFEQVGKGEFRLAIPRELASAPERPSELSQTGVPE